MVITSAKYASLKKGDFNLLTQKARVQSLGNQNPAAKNKLEGCQTSTDFYR